MRFTGKSVFIFGGNSGIGRATAIGFAAEGGRVCVTGRDRQTLEEVHAALPGGMALASDITDPAASRAAVAQAVAGFGDLDIVFINAGVGGFAPVPAVTEALWDNIHSTNLRGCFFAAQAVLPHLRPGGAMVFNGSVGSVMAVPGNVAYAAAKAGLRAVSRTIASEVVAQRIRVNMVSPGPTETPIIRRNLGQAPGEEDRLRALMIANTPLHRMAEAEEIARAVLFLASDEARFITGIDLFVDGGISEL
jgi:NAD(P)-dependent dehydrogenase (short-subunit alcohol dehydrogenase family)